jgi:hypothetical protein
VALIVRELLSLEVDNASLAHVDMRIVAIPEGERITPNG